MRTESKKQIQETLVAVSLNWQTQGDWGGQGPRRLNTHGWNERCHVVQSDYTGVGTGIESSVSRD